MVLGSHGFCNPTQIYFGRGCVSVLSELVNAKRCLIVTTQRGKKVYERHKIISKALAKAQYLLWFDKVRPNPCISSLQESLGELRESKLDIIIAIGGGSVIDSAKTFGFALASNKVDETLENLIMRSKGSVGGESIPVIAVPTTAGSGSEVTPFAAIWDKRSGRKLSLDGDYIFPAVACVDPSLTDVLPIDQTISSGLDAINQAFESIWNRNMSPISQIFAEEAIKTGIPALTKLSTHPTDTTCRNEMNKASLFAGLAISHTRTALCHSISYPLTAKFGVSHGLACAFTMPQVMRQSLAEFSGDDRFERLKIIMAGLDKTKDLSPFEILQNLNNHLDVAARVKNCIPSLDLVLELIPQMITPGRADSALFNVDQCKIKEIVLESWNCSYQKQKVS